MRVSLVSQVKFPKENQNFSNEGVFYRYNHHNNPPSVAMQWSSDKLFTASRGRVNDATPSSRNIMQGASEDWQQFSLPVSGARGHLAVTSGLFITLESPLNCSSNKRPASAKLPVGCLSNGHMSDIMKI